MFAQGLVKDLVYAGLNTGNWGVLAADRKAWRTTLDNLCTNGAKLIAAACADAATADFARDLGIGASTIAAEDAAADAEAARIVVLEQVETATRAAPAAAATMVSAPASTAASRGCKRKGGVEGGRGGGGAGKRHRA